MTVVERADVLVIEDDVDLLGVLVELLRSEGYQVIAAETGLDALRQLSRGLPPRMILLDLSMPEMDGWAFRAAQRQTPSLAAVPVVVMSAARMNPVELAELGGVSFLAKPLELPALLDAVARLAGRQAPGGGGS